MHPKSRGLRLRHRLGLNRASRKCGALSSHCSCSASRAKACRSPSSRHTHAGEAVTAKALSPGVAEATQLDYVPNLGSHLTFELWAHLYRWHANRIDCDVALICPREGFKLQLAAPCTALLYLTAVLLESGLWILYTLICSLQATPNVSVYSAARSSPASHSEWIGLGGWEDVAS